MTAKQKANAQRFKKAIAEAKKLRKKNPKLTQAEAVKQAYAILYKAGKVAGAKKTATKKKAVKKPARKKATAKSYHKDTKSHNVRISVVSGVKNKYVENTQISVIKQFEKYSNEQIDELNRLLNQISNLQINKDRFAMGIKYKKYSKEDTKKARQNIKDINNYIKILKKSITQVKKSIK